MGEARHGAGRCTCRYGRDHDGSEFGPCEFCEAAADDERKTAALMLDAARWRITQISRPRGLHTRGGFFAFNPDDNGIVRVGIQPHPVTKSWTLNHCFLGEGRNQAEAIDGLFLSLDAYVAEGNVLPDEIEGPRALARAALAKANAATGGR